MRRLSTLERAFELARSGECATIEALRSRLDYESYFDGAAQTSAPTVRKQLLALLKESAPGIDGKPVDSRKSKRKPGVLHLAV